MYLGSWGNGRHFWWVALRWIEIVELQKGLESDFMKRDF
jgi:hypothetical protein